MQRQVLSVHLACTASACQASSMLWQRMPGCSDMYWFINCICQRPSLIPKLNQMAPYIRRRLVEFLVFNSIHHLISVPSYVINRPVFDWPRAGQFCGEQLGINVVWCNDANTVLKGDITTVLEGVQDLSWIFRFNRFIPQPAEYGVESAV